MNATDSAVQAVSTLSDLALRGFVAASKADPRLAAAKSRLGTERYAEVACETLRRALKRELVECADERRAELASGHGALAAKAVLMGVVAEAVAAVLAA